MHKLIYFLTEADKRKEAEAKVEGFLDANVGDGMAFDWWDPIDAGRWKGETHIMHGGDSDFFSQIDDCNKDTLERIRFVAARLIECPPPAISSEAYEEAIKKCAGMPSDNFYRNLSALACIMNMDFCAEMNIFDIDRWVSYIDDVSIRLMKKSPERFWLIPKDLHY